MANEQKIKEAIEGLTFHVPPRCQGQIVEYAYACDADLVYVRVRDRSDGRVEYRCYEHDEGEAGDWQPWNVEPNYGEHIITIPDWA